MKSPDDVKKGLECLDKMQFFMGQRAGRELWNEKPHDVQECDLEQYNHDVDTVRTLIQQLEAQAPRWISVEERLPEDDVNVLIYAVSNGDEVDSCIAMTSYTHHMHGFNIEGWHSPWQYFFFDYMITHWMPLPEPPKEPEA